MAAPVTTAPSPQSQLALLRRLEWRVRHAVENILSGEYRSAFRGRGMEFDQVVKYTFGDDVRDIDWNVTARLGEPYRKKFVEEREVTLLVVFEDSPSLHFGSGAQSKREALMELAGLVMLLGAVNRDRVGFVHAAPRHSILLWLGDFPPQEPPEGWSVLTRRYQTMGFRVDDPWELELPDTRVLTAYDPVAGRLVNLNAASPAQRAAHAEWAARRQDTFRTLFPDPLSRLTVRTDEERLEALVRFFHARMAAGNRR